MKILLVQSPSIPNRNTGPPQGLAYIASLLEEDGHKVKIIDSIILRYSIEDIKNAIIKFDPDILGISSTTPYFHNVPPIVKIAKDYNPNCLIVLGGIHPTIMHKNILEMNSKIDVIVRGEGEITFTELAGKFEKGKELVDIKGISLQSEGKIFINQNRPLIEDLDSIPFPAYHLLPMKKYIIQEKIINIGLVGKQGQRYGTIVTSRGCPYDCYFCASRTFWSGNWRSRSPKNIVEELKILCNQYGQKVIEFYDDSFTVDKKRVLNLCKLIQEENIDFSWICETRVNLFDNEIASSLKKAGCEFIVFGIESGVQQSLDFINKNITVDESIRAVKIAKENGLKVGSPFMIGIPGETKKMMMKTLLFAKKLNLDYNAYGLLTPLPGTKVYEMAEKNNWILSRDFSKYNFGNPVMKIPGFTQEELKGFLHKARLYYFLNSILPLRVIKNLKQFIKGL